MLFSEEKSTGHLSSFLSVLLLSLGTELAFVGFCSAVTGLDGAKSAVFGLIKNDLSPRKRQTNDNVRQSTKPTNRKYLFFTRSLP